MFKKNATRFQTCDTKKSRVINVAVHTTRFESGMGFLI